MHTGVWRDARRLYLMFVAPPDKKSSDRYWLEGAFRFSLVCGVAITCLAAQKAPP